MSTIYTLGNKEFLSLRPLLVMTGEGGTMTNSFNLERLAKKSKGDGRESGI